MIISIHLPVKFSNKIFNAYLWNYLMMQETNKNMAIKAHFYIISLNFVFSFRNKTKNTSNQIALSLFFE